MDSRIPEIITQEMDMIDAERHNTTAASNQMKRSTRRKGNQRRGQKTEMSHLIAHPLTIAVMTLTKKEVAPSAKRKAGSPTAMRMTTTSSMNMGKRFQID